MRCSRVVFSTVLSLLAGVGCHDDDHVGSTAACPRSVAAACAEYTLSTCPATWQDAEIDRAHCIDKYITESTWDCPEHFLLRYVSLDVGEDFLYDKATGNLVAFLSWSANTGGPDTCLGGPTDLPVITLSGCTQLGDCQSQPDGGSGD